MASDGRGLETGSDNLTGIISGFPYCKSSSGPSYNSKVRVGNTRKNRFKDIRESLNRTILALASTMRDSSECVYFDAFRLPIFIEFIREHTGNELNLQYDAQVEYLQNETVDARELDRFKLVVFIRSLNRMINDEWKTTYDSFFKNELLLGGNTAQQNARDAFQHNSNRNRWKQELLTKSVGLVETKALTLYLKLKDLVTSLKSDEP